MDQKTLFGCVRVSESADDVDDEEELSFRESLATHFFGESFELGSFETR